MENRINTEYLYDYFNIGDNACLKNSRVKYYRNPDGDLIPYELMCCSRQVFVPSGLEASEINEKIDNAIEYRKAAAEIFGGAYGEVQHYQAEPRTKAELLHASRCRARRKVFDYCICNDFDCFITLTLDKNQIDRKNYGEVIKKLNTFLSNRVQRRGLKYLGVPEYHKGGGLHFHFAATSNAFKLIDSGCVSVEGRKRPIKNTTADRLGIPAELRHTVYNITDWKLGFSTAIKTYGQRGAVAHYLSKELSKDCQKSLCDGGNIDKIGGRWYYHSNNLSKPVVRLENRNFHEMEGYSYSMTTDGGDFKVYKFDENGQVLT